MDIVFAILDVTMEISRKSLLLATLMFSLCLSLCSADDAPTHEVPATDDAPTHEVPATDDAPTHEDPPMIVGKAMVCFDHVYECPPEHCLSPSGTLNVHKEETDEYCNGGCFDGTMLVLTCLDQILSNFEFYNKATIDNVRQTITEACSNTDKRGDFDVSERISAKSKGISNLRRGYGGAIMISGTICALLAMV